MRTKGRTSFFHHRRGSSHWNEKKHNLPTKHVTLLVSMGLCASASMYICAIFCRTEGEEEEERARVCFCEERCVPAAPCRDAAEGGVELAATLREDAELIVTGRRLPGEELCLRPLKTALIQGGGGGAPRGMERERGESEGEQKSVFLSLFSFHLTFLSRFLPLPKSSELKQLMVRVSFNQDSSCLALADRRGIRVWSLGRGTVVFEESLGGVR